MYPQTQQMDDDDGVVADVSQARQDVESVGRQDEEDDEAALM